MIRRMGISFSRRVQKTQRRRRSSASISYLKSDPHTRPLSTVSHMHTARPSIYIEGSSIDATGRSVLHSIALLGTPARSYRLPAIGR